MTNLIKRRDELSKPSPVIEFQVQIETLKEELKASQVRVQELEDHLKDARWQANEWMRAAKSWEKDCDVLKNKYEPLLAVTSDTIQASPTTSQTKEVE